MTKEEIDSWIHKLNKGERLYIRDVGWTTDNTVWDRPNPTGADRMSAVESIVSLLKPNTLQVVSTFVDAEGRGRLSETSTARSTIGFEAFKQKLEWSWFPNSRISIITSD